ncbi:MAG: HEAT repeat domain-containing protein [Gemmatimonadota bacterium]
MRPAGRHLVVGALAAAGLLAASGVEAAQDGGPNVLRSAAEIEAAVGSADGVARFELAARPGVWGNGRTWNFSRSGDGDVAEFPGRHCDGCTNGPIRVTLRVDAGVVTGVHSQVGGRWREEGRDLGPVAPAAGADYLLGLVERERTELDADSKEEALQAAVSTPAGDIWPRLLGVARSRGQPADVRKAALFWTAHEAGVRAADDIENIAVASDEETEVQEAAVFALTQLPDERGTEVLLRLARENRNPDIVRSVYFWLGQREDPRVLALFEEVLLD